MAKPITFTEDEIKALRSYVDMASETYARKAKDPRNPEGVAKHYHDGVKYAKTMSEKLQAAL